MSWYFDHALSIMFSFPSTGLPFPVYFLGHMVPLEDKEEIMFIGTPHFDSLGDLISSTTYLTNIPQDNMTMEIMFMNEQRRADVEMRYRRHHYVFCVLRVDLHHAKE